MKAKIIKGKLAILAITGVVAVTLTAGEGTMRTIAGMGLTIRMVTNMITRVVPLTDTALGITGTCTSI